MPWSNPAPSSRAQSQFLFKFSFTVTQSKLYSTCGHSHAQCNDRSNHHSLQFVFFTSLLFLFLFPFLELNFLWFVICGAFYCVKCNVGKSTPPTFHCLLWSIGQRQWWHLEFNGKTNDFNVQFLFLCHSLNPISDKLSSPALCHFLYPLVVLWCTFSRTHVVLT